jgi:protein-disulfide isomerase
MRSDEEARLSPPVDENDHLRGSPDAPVTLVEYGDFECPYCGMAYPILKKLEQLASDLVRVAFRYFPLTNLHPHAALASEAAESAAAQGKFWEMHDLIFEHQDRLTRADLEIYAGRAGVELDQFRNDLDTHRWASKVRDQFRSGVISGVNGTPTFFVNGRRHDGGYQLEELVRLVTDEAMRVSGGPKPSPRSLVTP